MAPEIKPLIVITMVTSLSLASRFVTQTSRSGVRCIIKSDKYLVSDTEEYHHCVIRCIYKRCPFFNYNMAEQFFQLSDERCVSLVLDNQYNLTSFIPPVRYCFQWIPATGSDSNYMVPTSSCHVLEAHDICYVGRLISGPHALPGKYYIAGGGLYTSMNGQMHTSGQKEVLTVVPGCQVGWMSYTAGNVIPTRAVAGGFLSSGSGSSLFVIRGLASGYMSIGYYDPNTDKGYVEYGGVNVLTEMGVLVEVWFTCLYIIAPLPNFPPGFCDSNIHSFKAPSYWRLGSVVRQTLHSNYLNISRATHYFTKGSMVSEKTTPLNLLLLNGWTE